MDKRLFAKRIRALQEQSAALAQCVGGWPEQHRMLVQDIQKELSTLSADLQTADLAQSDERAKEREQLQAIVLGEGSRADELAVALNRERGLLEAITENTETQLAYLDRDFNFVRVNSSYARGSGYSKGDLIGRNHFDLFPNAENEAIFRKARDTGELVSFRAKPFVYPARPELGTTYWDWWLSPVKDESGLVHGLVFSLTDVTERERTAQILRQRESEFRMLAEHMPDLVSRFDTELRYLYVNPAAERAAGLSLESIIGKTNEELGMPPALCATWRERMSTVLATGQPASMSFELPRSDGLAYYDARIIPEFARDGPVGSVLCVVRDDTERQKLLAEVQSERAKLQAVIDHALDAIRVVDEQGRLVLANPVADKLYGKPLPYGEDYDSNRRLGLCYPDGTPYEPRHLPIIRSAFDGETYRNVELMLVLPDGERRYLLVNAAPIRGPLGEITGAISISQDFTEQRLSRERLRRQSAILDQVSDAIISTGLDLKIESWNKGAEALYGWRAEEAIGRPLTEALHTRYLIGSREQALAVIAQEGRWSGEVVQQRNDGSRIDVQSSVALLRDSAGKSVGMAAVNRDITDRKRAEAALHLYAYRAELFKAMAQAVLAATSIQGIAEIAMSYLPQLLPCVTGSVALYDLASNEVSLAGVYPTNRALMQKEWLGPLEWVWFLDEARLGITRQEEDLQTLPAASPLIQALQAAGVRASVHVPIIAQGKLIGCLNAGLAEAGRFSPEQLEIVQEMGNQLAVGIAQARLHEQVQRHAGDLERAVKKRTAELRQSEEQFRSIFEDAPIGIALVGRGGRFLVTNPALQRMLGYSAEELEGPDHDSLVHPDDRQSTNQMLAAVRAGEYTSYTAERRFLRKDGQQIWAIVTMSRLRRSRAQSGFAISMFEDISARKEAQDALIRAEKFAITGRLAAALTHEVNNPLQSVIGCLALAEEVLAEGKEATRYLQVAREEVRRAADIVSRLRDLNRSVKPEERKSVDINAVLQRILTLSEKRCRDRCIEVACDMTSSLPPLPLVADRIEQVFLNLLLNAIEAMPDGGSLQISTARTNQPDGVRIVFKDSGTGISPELLPRIFEPFHTDKADGLGLGLYVSQKVVQEHKGHIEVESSVGQGSTFIVWLPD